MQALSLILALCAVLLAIACQAQNQQDFCANPPKGCGSQMKEKSCINWHGCEWSCTRQGAKCGQRKFNNGKKGFGCLQGKKCCFALTEEQCATKPFRTPTKSPTRPTRTPTNSPTVICHIPVNGCPSATTAVACNGFNGCQWNTDAKKCDIGGCSGTYAPTLSPTPCNDLPANGCGGANTKANCQLFSCCKWIVTGKCVHMDAAEPPACPQLGNQNACQKRSDCRWSNKKCITRGSQG